jgi:hypothetical protein
MLAKAVASGKTLLECSQLTGYRQSVISDLKNDPAFQELVAFYAEELHQVYVDVHARMAAFGTSVLEELQERFEREPDKFTKRELLDLFTSMADRSIPTAKGGPAPQQTIVSGGGNGLALQINFVSPVHDAPQTLEATLAPVAPALSTAPLDGYGEVRPLEARPILADKLGMPPGLDVDGEPFVPHTPTPKPSHADIAQAKIKAAEAASAQREAEALERDTLRAEYLAKRFNPNA